MKLERTTAAVIGFIIFIFAIGPISVVAGLILSFISVDFGEFAVVITMTAGIFFAMWAGHAFFKAVAKDK